jgi:uncharacterized YkwD family protein
MKKALLVLILIVAQLFSVSCMRQAAIGKESSISGTNDITRLKVIYDQVAVRSGCSNSSPSLQSVSKGDKLDVLGKVADWYAVKLSDNSIGFIPQKQSTPVIPNEIKPGTAANYAPTAPNTKPGAQGTKLNTPNTTQTNNNALTSQEQQMFNLVNQARAQANVPALKIDMELTKMARIKSQDMIDNNYFSHNSPKYGSPFDMMKSFGINYVSAGENIAGNQTVQAAEDALMNSPGHRKNILSTDYTHIGIGIRSGGQFGLMFTQDFISKPT